MRLIRLQTDQNNCIFDNTFQDDILIQPGAKIALQNACILKTPESVYIGNLDNTIIYTISNSADGADPPTITLDTGSYNKDNFEVLLAEITAKMNRALRITRARHLGIQSPTPLMMTTSRTMTPPRDFVSSLDICHG